MAKIQYSDFGNFEAGLEKLGREGIRRVVMAGAEAAGVDMRARIVQARHVRTGDMRDSVAPGVYHEGLNSAWVEVYPQGDDRRGISNTRKAFYINNGRGGKRTARMGDKFLTGRKKQTDELVRKAMQAESDRIIQEMNGG